MRLRQQRQRPGKHQRCQAGWRLTERGGGGGERKEWRDEQNSGTQAKEPWDEDWGRGGEVNVEEEEERVEVCVILILDVTASQLLLMSRLPVTDGIMLTSEIRGREVEGGILHSHTNPRRGVISIQEEKAMSAGSCGVTDGNTEARQVDGSADSSVDSTWTSLRSVL